MQKNNKITVGELSKLASVSVRTLQYYDKIGLLKSSTMSEGGRRLYNANDITVLQQIITLKSFGLSLKDIEERIMPIDSTEDIVNVLNRQSAIIEEQISKSRKVLESINMIEKEIKESNTVDWSKYSSMVKLISDNNEYYWVINYLEQDILSSITEIHEKHTEIDKPIDWLKKCLEKVIELDKKGVSPQSNEAQEIAEEWWQFVQRYTKGDARLIEQLYRFYSSSGQWPAKFGEIQKQSQIFLEKIIEFYLAKNKLNIPMIKT